MKLVVLSARDVHALLRYDECAAAMRAALTALQSGQAQMPLRTVIRPDGAAGLMALMPAYQSGASPAYGLKALCITPANPTAGLDTHQGAVLVSDGATGEPVALLNASAITEIRTAAMSVVATGLLARPDADVLAVIGAGVQARSHVLALDQSRALREVRIASRTPARARQLAASLAKVVQAPFVRACEGTQEALAGAGIVVTATNSPQPVLRAEWLAPGAHLNAVGACLPSDRELDTATVAGAVLFADRRDSLLTESGDYALAAAEGAVTPAHIRAELGEILTGAAAGRLSDTEITIFESLGLAVEDLAAARCAYERAVATGEGNWIEF
jgi:ornithine cyclodeaminase/alanine dehydrogenase-like protein (mu-crystallin family)